MVAQTQGGFRDPLSYPSFGGAATSERHIWEAAILLTRAHGIDAAAVAAREALKHQNDRDQLRYVVWRWIARAATDLLKPEPDDNEYVQ